MDLFTLILMGFLVISVIRSISATMHQKQMEMLDDKFKEGMEKLKQTIIPSTIEEANGMLLMYNSETNEFLAQGKTMQELNENAKLRFPDKLFNVPQEIIDKHMKVNIHA